MHQYDTIYLMFKEMTNDTLYCLRMYICIVKKSVKMALEMVNFKYRMNCGMRVKNVL